MIDTIDVFPEILCEKERGGGGESSSMSTLGFEHSTLGVVRYVLNVLTGCIDGLDPCALAAALVQIQPVKKCVSVTKNSLLTLLHATGAEDSGRRLRLYRATPGSDNAATGTAATVHYRRLQLPRPSLDERSSGLVETRLDRVLM